MDLPEQMNRISEALFGYREARHDEIISRIQFLVEFERDTNAGHALKGDKARTLVSQLHALLEGE